jgi:D-alanyl-D-alanine carboxypeptidase
VPYTDVTVLNPTVGAAAGGMVSIANDVATFYRALMSGNLLPPAQLQELKTGVQEGTTNNYSGLGIESIATPCGQVWAKNGAVPGYDSLAATSEDRSKQIVVTGTEYNLQSGSGAAHLATAAQNAFCAS